MIIQKCILIIISLGRLAFSFDHPNWNLLNDTSCGLNSPVQRIHKGRNANLGEFPWMVIVSNHKIYANGSDIYYICGGSILNSRYILSATHCFVDSEVHQMEYKVIIGDYDKSRDPDCEGDVCAPGRIIYDIEEVINHPNYFMVFAGSDITLVRVKGVISFNEFVAPICLEYGSLLTHDYTGENAHVAGWGTYSFADEDRKKQIYPTVLQTLTVPVTDESTCQNAMLYIGYEFKHYHIIESQICAGGIVEEFVYMGDSGGPLMSVKQIEPDSPARFYQIGVVSYGLIVTRTPLEYPTIYTRVRYYLPWILDNIRP